MTDAGLSQSAADAGSDVRLPQPATRPCSRADQPGRPITFFSACNIFSGSTQTGRPYWGTGNAHMGNIQIESSGQTYYFTATQGAQFPVPDAGGLSNEGP